MRLAFSAHLVLFATGFSALTWTHPAKAEIAKAEIHEPTDVFLYGEKPLHSGERPKIQHQEGAVIELGMARDSFETILIRINSDQHASGPVLPKNVHLTLKKAIAAPDTAESTLELKSYWVGTQRFQKSSYSKAGSTAASEVPDIVIPLEIASHRKFKIPPDNIPAHPYFLFELHAPESMEPQSLEADLGFLVDKIQYHFPLRIKIYRTALPKSFTLKTSFGWDPTSAMNKHYGHWDDHFREMDADYFKLATEHRIDLHKIYLQFPKSDSPELDPLTTSVVPADSYMGLWEPLANGKLSDYRYAWSMTNLPVPEEMKTLKTDEKKLEGFWKSLDSSVLKHHLEKSHFVYFSDEPQASQLKSMGTALRKIKTWAPDLQFLVTKHYSQELAGGVDIWCPNLSQWDKAGFPSPDFYEYRQMKKGEKLWLYTSCNAHGCGSADDAGIADLVTDRPSAYARAFPWMAFRYHADGILYYNTIEGYDPKDKESPWRDKFSFHGYGEGNLFYPCNENFCGLPTQAPLASLRLKSIRDGLQDVEILEVAKKSGLPVDLWVKQMIPSVKSFPKETAAYHALVIRVLEALDHI